MTAADAVVTVAFLLFLFSGAIFVQWAIREIGWYRARQELRKVERQRDAELRAWRSHW